MAVIRRRKLNKSIFLPFLEKNLPCVYILVFPPSPPPSMFLFIYSTISPEEVWNCLEVLPNSSYLLKYFIIYNLLATVQIFCSLNMYMQGRKVSVCLTKVKIVGHAHLFGLGKKHNQKQLQQNYCIFTWFSLKMLMKAEGLVCFIFPVEYCHRKTFFTVSIT